MTVNYIKEINELDYVLKHYFLYQTENRCQWVSLVFNVPGVSIAQK